MQPGETVSQHGSSPRKVLPLIVGDLTEILVLGMLSPSWIADRPSSVAAASIVLLGASFSVRFRKAVHAGTSRPAP